MLPWCDLLSAACSMNKLWGREMGEGVTLVLNQSTKKLVWKQAELDHLEASMAGTDVEKDGK